MSSFSNNVEVETSVDSSVSTVDHNGHGDELPSGNESDCDQTDACGHHCHAGHCHGLLAKEGQILPSSLGKAEVCSLEFLPNPFLGGLFRPPIS